MGVPTMYLASGIVSRGISLHARVLVSGSTCDVREPHENGLIHYLQRGNELFASTESSKMDKKKINK